MLDAATRELRNPGSNPDTGIMLMVSAVLGAGASWADLINPGEPEFYFFIMFLIGAVMTGRYYLGFYLKKGNIRRTRNIDREDRQMERHIAFAEAEVERLAVRPMRIWRLTAPMMKEALDGLERLKRLGGSEWRKQWASTEVLLGNVIENLDQIGVRHPGIEKRGMWISWLRRLINWASWDDPEGLQRAIDERP